MKKFEPGQKLLCVKSGGNFWGYPRIGTVHTYKRALRNASKANRYDELIYTATDDVWPRDAFISLPDEIDRKAGK